jgi:2-phospho-L-lactate guanylyltransferase (CobY/MobA/RfbA family)
VHAGKAAGALTLVRSQLGLALDIDTPDDLLDLVAAHPTGHTAAALPLLLPQHALVRS